MRAVLDGKLVAVLAPTTILAFQHAKTFRKRFQPFPVKVEHVSRMRSSREVRQVLEAVKRGQVDILLGTHRILSKDVEFRDLGLLVVDEEQRFGVTAKEKLKQLRTSVDCLTLSATPIPRTLQMGLGGIRDMSVIETPPKDRLATQTAIVKFSTDVIAAAIRQELQRDGQVYFVHNRVESIYSVANTKLAEVKANPASRAFIIADAKDADMAFGVRAQGPRSYLSVRGERPARFSPEVWTRDEFGYRNLPEFLDIIREVVHQGLVDIMLMSAYVNEQLAIKEGLFTQTQVTPAASANDTTDIWAIRHGAYTREPAQPVRSATIDHIQCGKISCDRTGDAFPGANLGLYSVTFVNQLEQDRETLRGFKEFREEADPRSG